VIPVGDGASSKETQANRDLCVKLKEIEFISVTDEDYNDYVDAVLHEAGVIIDAIYGIGFKGTLSKEVAELIEDVNDTDAFKVAIDIPSGINADTGYAELAFEANITFAMESLKYGHLLGMGKLCSGQIEVVPIGVPEMLWEDEEFAIKADEQSVFLPLRSKLAHKGDCGRIAVFAGSAGYTGAAYMASMAALKAGAGLVTIFCQAAEMMYYTNKPYEVMVKVIPQKADGKVDTTALKTLLKPFDIILFGPGCGTSDYTYQILSFLVSKWDKPAVIDADGLNTLALHQNLLPKLAGKPIVLTPHWGEFCRLSGVSIEELHQDCILHLKKFVKANKLKVLLKSDTSIYFDTNTMFINTSGNDGLATGGSGDILSGLIAGFMAQKLTPELASATASYYLGYTAEKLAETQETFSITPTDILNSIFKFDASYDADENND
jgi:NAD(P)H-hydrate epimerase